MTSVLNYSKPKIKKDCEYKLGVIFTVIPALIFAIILCNKTMPLAEGWYTYYAQIINEGSIVYKDFEYLFMPGYITFIALFTKIFGYSIIALRILGVIFFTLIAYFAYRIFTELFTPVAGCLGAVATVFYLQSEIVQIFYDYIRMMDIFAYITIFLLVKMSKNFIDGKNDNLKITLFAGMANAMVLMIKQNIGLLYGFFVLCYFIFLIMYKSDKKNVFKNLIFYGIGAAVIFAGYGIYLLANGALVDCIQQTLLGASEAKGGIKTALFQWIVDGENNFIAEKNILFIVGGIAVLLLLLNKFFPSTSKSKKSAKKNIIAFGILSVVFILIEYFSQGFSEGILKYIQTKSYGFYLLITIIFFVMIVLYLIDMRRKGDKRKYNDYLGIFLLFGSIFAIGYGVGMSGSLAQSQIALSVGLIISILISLCKNRFNCISMSLITVFSLCFVVFCGAYKMVNTYSWWGLTCPSIWEETEETDVPMLKGIKVSEQEKEMYEGIYDIIQTETSENDTIFCFPHCPELYTMTNRTDPGTTTKVQWFDVSSNDAVEDDIEIVEDAQPAAIIMYNIPQFAIDGHESSFNNNKQSATTTMYKTLKKYCLRNSYVAKAKYFINSSCSITVWVKDTSVDWCSSGIGTKEDPFIISTKEQFLSFAELVNGGAKFESLYVALDTDIDLSGVDDYTPIGDEKAEASFDGTFDGQGHVIKNLRLVVDPTFKKLTEEEKAKSDAEEEKPNNVALFGAVNGTIMNLGLENCEISGYCSAGLVRNSVDTTSKIINCYVKNCEITGKLRAGSIADDYAGYLYNCYSINVKLDADSCVGVISYRNNGVNFEECYTNIKYFNDKADVVTLNEINSVEFAENANKNVRAYVDNKTTAKKAPRPICTWAISDSEFGFSGKTYSTVQEPMKVE